MINWRDIEQFDEYLDEFVSSEYKDQPLAQDWARISKTAEEVGEAIQKFIGWTGQNPRKGYSQQFSPVLDELADVAFTAIYAIQHFTKDIQVTQTYLLAHQEKARRYAKEGMTLRWTFRHISGQMCETIDPEFARKLRGTGEWTEIPTKGGGIMAAPPASKGDDKAH